MRRQRLAEGRMQGQRSRQRDRYGPTPHESQPTTIYPNYIWGDDSIFGRYNE